MGPQQTTVQENLSTYFDSSAGTVRKHADRFEHKYARPALRWGAQQFEAYPTRSAFGATLLLLSVFPIVTFIGFSLFFISSLVIIAVSCVSVATIVIEIVFGLILASVLAFFVFVAAGFTAFAVSAYFFLRLLVLLRTEGREGLGEWMAETREHFTRQPRRGVSEASSSDIVLVDDRDREPVLSDEFTEPGDSETGVKIEGSRG